MSTNLLKNKIKRLSSSDKKKLASLLKKYLIKSDSTDNTFKLSNAQKRYWFYQKIYPDSAICNIPAVLKIKGCLDYLALQNSLHTVIKKNPILNINILQENGELRQHYSSNIPNILQLDLKCLDDSLKASEAERIIKCFLGRPFNIEKDQLIRVALLALDENQHILVFSFHHIIMDGWSLNLFFNAFKTYYEAYCFNRELNFIETNYNYEEYVKQELSEKSKALWDQQAEFWQKYLHDMPKKVNFLLPVKKVSMLENLGQMHDFNIPISLSNYIRKFSKEQNITIYMYMMSVFVLLLNYLSSQKDLVISTPYGNRNTVDFEKTMGLFQNLILLRTKIDYEKSFEDFVSDIKEICLLSFKNSDIPYNEVVNHLKKEDRGDLLNLTNVMYIYNNAPLKNIKLGELELTPTIYDIGYVHADLTLVIFEDNTEGLRCRFEYNYNVISEDEINNFEKAFLSLIENSLNSPSIKIKDIPCYTQTTASSVYTKGEIVPLDNINITKCIDEISINNPNSISLQHNDSTFTFQQFNAHINQLCFYLVEKQGVKSGDVIGIVSKRSILQNIALLTILRIKAIYLPIEINNNTKTHDLKYIISDSKVKVILSEDTDLFGNEELSGVKILPILNWNDWKDSISTYPSSSPLCINDYYTDNDIAYLIYTSGTTGNKKGVKGTYVGLINRLMWYWDTYPYAKKEICCQKTNIGFIDSITEILSPLLKGVKLVVLDDEVVKSYTKLGDVLNSLNVSRITLVPSLLKKIIESLPPDFSFTHLKYLVSSGEALDYTLAKFFVDKHKTVRLINLYGSSEVTGDVTYYEFQAETNSEWYNSPIGKPIYNTALYVLNENLMPVPSGIIGKLCVSTLNIAKGYLHNISETNHKFIANHFFRSFDSISSKLYNTGDLCRFSFNNELDYIGREDGQIKHRGYRVELSAIEKYLNMYPGVEEAVVIPDKDKAILIAVIKTKNEILTDKIRRYLSDNIPSYMIPERYVLTINDFPLNNNQKIDRNQLKNTILTENKRDTKERELKYYLPKWRESSIEIQEPSLIIKQNILIFSENTIFEKNLYSHINQENNIIIVEKSNGYKKYSKNHYSLPVGVSYHYNQLIEDIKKDFQQIDYIIYAWGISYIQPSNQQTTIYSKIDKAENVLTDCFYSLTSLIQAINFKNDIHLAILITQYCHHIWKGATIPEKSTIQGLVNVLHQERKNITTKCIDIGINPNKNPHVSYNALSKLVSNEIFTFYDDKQISFLNLQRLRLDYEEVDLSNNNYNKNLYNNMSTNSTTPNTYLITGGLGGIGLVIGNYIAESNQDANIIILGRSKLPSRTEWTNIIKIEDNSGQNQVIKRINSFLELEKKCGSLEYIDCDVSNSGLMQVIFKKIYKTYGSINGVIHAAGTLNLALISSKSHEDISDQFNAKIFGTMVLNEFIDFDALEYMILCSSVNAIVGGVGTSDYAAANCFLDSYANQKNIILKQNKVFSINWDMWKEVGMAKMNETLPLEFKKKHLEKLNNAILNKEAVSAIYTILNLKNSQVVVTPSHLDSIFKHEDELLYQYKENNNFNNQQPYLTRPLLETIYDKPEGECENKLADIWLEVLNIIDIGANDNFFDLGGHSLIAAQIVDRVNTHFNSSLTLRDLFNNPTIRSLKNQIYNK